VTQAGQRKGTRAERLSMPLARDVVKDLAVEHGACLRPVQLRRTDLATGQAEPVLVPCGNTLASVCPSCAERAKALRAAQCREGWHLDREPVIEPDEPTGEQRWWVEKRADAQAIRDQAEASGDDTSDLDELVAELDDEITEAGMRGNVLPARPERRHRSTRRRQDAPPLPKRIPDPRTIGKTYTAPDGKVFRPSLFVTLTCPSYGRVTSEGTPVNPDGYDYTRAARDALHFAALFDRFMQNLRRYCGYDIQYFAAIEPQRRLAPHVHIAIRGTISRKELREVIAATYHQVWWPPTDQVAFDGSHLPVWDDKASTYLDPATGEVLPTWDDALDSIGDQDEPLHVARFGDRFDAQGVLAGSKDASRCIGYLTKYLTKNVGACHTPDTDAQARHAERLAGTLRFEPCSPTCANWLRYGIQPKNAKPNMMPGRCKGKAHRADHLGYAGRRVLVSRKWSGKTLADHRADRKAWLMAMLDLPATDPERYAWEPVKPSDADNLSTAHRLLRVVGDRIRWRQALDEARRRAQGQPPDELSATGEAA
jgi:replication initiator protein RepSA